MNSKIFLPPIDSQWRLSADWTPPRDFARGDNSETMTGDNWSSIWNAAVKSPSVGSPPRHPSIEYDAWSERYDKFRDERAAAHGFDGTLPAGTVLQIERYHVSRSGENVITIKVLASPSKFLTPRKHKGLMRGAGRLYFNLDQFNTLPEVEKLDAKI